MLFSLTILSRFTHKCSVLSLISILVNVAEICQYFFCLELVIYKKSVENKKQNSLYQTIFLVKKKFILRVCFGDRDEDKYYFGAIFKVDFNTIILIKYGNYALFL